MWPLAIRLPSESASLSIVPRGLESFNAAGRRWDLLLQRLAVADNAAMNPIRRFGAFMLLMTAEMRPSFHKSPTASPRAELTAVIAGPALEEMSVNLPLPLL